MRWFVDPNNPVVRFVVRMADMICVAFMWFITSIPLVTIGASTAAAYYVCLSLIRDKEGKLVKTYFTSFIANFKRATIIWIILLVSALPMLYNAYIIYFVGTVIPIWFQIFFYIATVIWIMCALYAFPLQAQFENKVKNTLVNSIRIALTHIPNTIFVLIFHGVAVWICVLLPVTVIVVPGVAIFLTSQLYWNALKNYVSEDQQ